MRLGTRRRLEKVKARFVELMNAGDLEPYQRVTWQQTIDYLADHGSRMPICGVIPNILAPYLPPMNQCRWRDRKVSIILGAIVDGQKAAGQLERLKDPRAIPEVIAAINDALGDPVWVEIEAQWTEDAKEDEDIIHSRAMKEIRIVNDWPVTRWTFPDGHVRYSRHPAGWNSPRFETVESLFTDV